MGKRLTHLPFRADRSPELDSGFREKSSWDISSIRKSLTWLIVFCVSFSAVIPPVDARLLPRVANSSKKANTVVTTSKGVTTAVKLRSDRRAVVLTFTNLSIASTVNYQLTYQSKGLSQGAQGSVTPGAAEPVSRELLFGTCSSGVCRYDSGITNAKLTVTTKLKTGKKVVKTYRIKV